MFKNSHFQNKTTFKTFLLKMDFICVRIKDDFHIDSFAPNLTLKQRLEATQRYSSNKDLVGKGATSNLSQISRRD